MSNPCKKDKFLSNPLNTAFLVLGHYIDNQRAWADGIGTDIKLLKEWRLHCSNLVRLTLLIGVNQFKLSVNLILLK